MQKSENIGKLASALAAFQTEIPTIPKTHRNLHFKNKFANYTDIREVIREPLKRHGLAISFVPNNQTLSVMLMHGASEQWLSGEYPLLPQRPDPQSVAAANTYAIRNSAIAILGIDADDDDDGNTAMGLDNKNEKAAAGTLTSSPTQNQPQQTDTFDDIPGHGAAEYVCTFGKHKGKKMSEISLKDAEGYAQYLLQMAQKDGKEPNPNVRAFVAALEAYKAKLARTMDTSDAFGN